MCVGGDFIEAIACGTGNEQEIERVQNAVLDFSQVTLASYAGVDDFSRADLRVAVTGTPPLAPHMEHPQDPNHMAILKIISRTSGIIQQLALVHWLRQWGPVGDRLIRARSAVSLHF